MSAAIAGRATPEATQTYCKTRGANLEPAGGVTLGGTGLSVSSVGFGCYRVYDTIDRHHRALTLALRSGVNLIDTSANYGDGGSEELVGKVLRRLIESDEITREQVVVVTKGGYIQGHNMDLAQGRERSGAAYPEVTKIYGELWHCIHPEFLGDQIDLSLARLGLGSADVYLLHNPEYFLQKEQKSGKGVAKTREEYYRRIREAILFLESKAREGKIGFYGISSNTFPKSAEEFDFTSLEKCWEMAEAIGPDHHFRVIQLPANLFEDGAWTERNQMGGTKTVLEFAREKNLGVLINRPLNAFAGDRLIRLSDPPQESAARASEIESRLRSLGALEEEGRGIAGDHSPGLARLIGEKWPLISSHQGWNAFLSQSVIPRAQEGLAAMAQATRDSSAYQAWQSRYIEAVNFAIESLGDTFEAAGRERLDAVHAGIDPVIPAAMKNAPLSQKAIWFLRSLPGVSCVLVGMRREEYVEDLLAAAAIPPGEIKTGMRFALE